MCSKLPRPAATLLPIFFAALLASCGFTAPNWPGCKEFEELPLTPLTFQPPQTVFESDGTIIAIHGSGSAQLNSGSSAAAIKVEQSVPIPAYANQATVFLNGWRLGYLDGDHHVFALGTLIARIRIELDPNTREKRIVWNAVGLLRDSDGKDGYSWSYNFTVVAWNDVNVKAAVDHGPTDGACPAQGVREDNFFHEIAPRMNTAMASLFSFIENKIFRAGVGAAVLPRGFAFHWWDHSLWDTLLENAPDHHIRQVAYNLDHSEVLIDDKTEYNIGFGRKHAPLPPGGNFVGSGFVSWNSYAILKDDSSRRDYGVAEVVSGMAGTDIGIVQPPFSILPSDNGSSTCATVASFGVRTQEIVIRDIPFEHAIPMLTGWNLEYFCSDQHVKHIGLWISRWRYEPPVGGGGGTMRYTLSHVLTDDDNSPDYFVAHKVAILGFKPMSAVAGSPVK